MLQFFKNSRQFVKWTKLLSLMLVVARIILKWSSLNTHEQRRHLISVFIGTPCKNIKIDNILLSILQSKTFIYMLRIAGQTAEPIGLKFFVETDGWRRVL